MAGGSSGSGDKSLATGENFVHQVLRCRLGINPQQRFGAGDPKQNPSIGSVAKSRCVEEELHSVQILLIQDGVAAKTRGPGGNRALYRGLFHPQRCAGHAGHNSGTHILLADRRPAGPKVCLPRP